MNHYAEYQALALSRWRTRTRRVGDVSCNGARWPRDKRGVRAPRSFTVFTALVATATFGASGDRERFEQYWYHGGAELSAYKLVQPRYGAPRAGRAVMVWVTEPFSRSKAVKLDHPEVAGDDVFPVLKLNHLRTFQTGIYPYRLMTSVFFPVIFGAKDPVQVAPVKVAFSGQEWCGTVYHQLVKRGDRWRSHWHSYFESEGEGEAEIPARPRLVFGDDLWFRVRELTAPFAPGTYDFMPSLAAVRLSHTPPELGTIDVRRSTSPETIRVPAGSFHVIRWDVEMRWGTNKSQRQTRTIWTEEAWPRRIIAWEGDVASFNGNEPQRERAELTGSIRGVYWQHNRPGDEALLDRLGL